MTHSQFTARLAVATVIASTFAFLASLLAAPAASAYWPRPSAMPNSQYPKIYRESCHALPWSTTVTLCRGGKYGADKRVLVFGDSHSAHWQPAISKAGEKYGFAVRSLTKSSCPAADVRIYRSGRSYTSCAVWRRQVFAKLARGDYGQFDLIVLSDFADNPILTSSGRVASGSARSYLWRAGLIRTVTRLRKATKQVLIIRDAPHLRRDALSCLSRYWPYNARACGTRESLALNGGIWWAERSVAAGMSRVYTADFSSGYCQRGICLPVDRGWLAFRDEHHWTRVYSERVLSQWIGPRIWPLIEGGASSQAKSQPTIEPAPPAEPGGGEAAALTSADAAGSADWD